jgi:cysteine desulfurase
MGLHDSRRHTALRLSLGRWTTTDEIDRAADLLATAARASA